MAELRPNVDQAGLRAAARTWMALDPDAETRDATTRLLQQGNEADLAEHFGERLAFGTAGLRAAMGPGPNRMNRLLVRQSAAGIARVMISEGVPNTAIVGHDARHRSARFAEDVVEVLEAHGISVMKPAGPVPTPLVAWAVSKHGLGAGLCVTASHNPASDNGLKVFWSDGAQIIPPIDARIATAIEAAARDRRLTPHPGSGAVNTRRLMVDRYLADTLDQVGAAGDPDLQVVTTALHGVGGAPLLQLLGAAGYTSVTPVPEQQVPDPDFPTVAFPNPEEPGALDAAIALATELGADLILANDPDADRLAVAVPDADDQWHTLTGNEVGALLAWWALQRSQGLPDRLLATTMVSSQLLEKMATQAGVHYAETLTGFKWLCRPALAHPQWLQLVAYEEAMGYAVGPGCRDKDGLLAALAVADLCGRLLNTGSDPLAVLDRLTREHGVHTTSQVSVRFDSTGWARNRDALVARLESNPPTALGGRLVESVDRPSDDLVRLFLRGGDRVAFRPSGTEPKFKAYLEVVEQVAGGSRAGERILRAARRRAGTRLEWMEHEVRTILGAPVPGGPVPTGTADGNPRLDGRRPPN
ncbi:MULTISPECIES: phospho-sugar mutase [Candidatus Neomicrothrix]|jgi:phosphomannomutase|uniref:Putative phosphoglucomutase n=1 Tax=Candidatus Neomicrothrix parvicella RN1 TaxID=1229780 RepID=R4YY79_9ACTN|nr:MULTISPECIES: phospho-sugar mutase [Microthrix]MBP7877262.1 phospho-sugar mutase [Candidatus Microthrix sp.]MBP9622464.1 phospho-sugar mutase [Candidatus Microthrix sp.]CCM63270.1 Putative phosphoglucomutase [Candidatus Microthrix parvicella RN1]